MRDTCDAWQELAKTFYTGARLQSAAGKVLQQSEAVAQHPVIFCQTRTYPLSPGAVYQCTRGRRGAGTETRHTGSRVRSGQNLTRVNTVNYTRIDTVNISIGLLCPDCFGKIPVLSCCLNRHSLVSDLCVGEDVNPGSAVQRDRQDCRTGLLSQDWERMLAGLAAGWMARYCNTVHCNWVITAYH